MTHSADIVFEHLLGGNFRATWAIDFSPSGALTANEFQRTHNYFLDHKPLRDVCGNLGLGEGKPLVECLLKIVDAESFDLRPILASKPSDSCSIRCFFDHSCPLVA